MKQYEIYWVNLDPTIGSEISKVRPCLIISPDELNLHLATLLVAPLTTTKKNYPFRVSCQIKNKPGEIALDQIRCISKLRIGDKISRLSEDKIQKVKSVLSDLLIE
jgi:mRNA interferase MazF